MLHPLQCSSPPPPRVVHRMQPAVVAATSLGMSARLWRRLFMEPSKFSTADRPSPLPVTSIISQNDTPLHTAGKSALPVKTNKVNHAFAHCHITHISNTQWIRLATLHDLQVLLIISGIEVNPGPSHSQTISVSHANINSVTSDHKMDELYQFVQTHNIHIMALTETKLDNSVDSSIYNIHGYHAPLTKHRTRHGGGVALYVHTSLPVQRLQHLEIGQEEWIWAKVKTKSFTLIICCLYLPPNQTANRLQDFIYNFSEAFHQSQRHAPTATLILGDINAGNVYLSDDMQFHSSGTTPFDRILKDTADALDLHQLIREPTRISTSSANLRDLIFTNNPEIVTDYGTLSPFAHLDHFPIFASLDITPPSHNTDNTKTLWDYTNMDAPLLTRILMDTDWTSILDNDVETATTLFTNAIYNAAVATIPIKIKQVKSNNKPWVTAELKRHIRKRERLFKMAKQTQTEYNWDRWRHQRNIVTSTNKRLKNEYMQRQVRKLLAEKTNPRKYHQTLRTIMGRTRTDTIPPLQGPDGEIITNDHEKATLLNNHFAAQSTINISNSHRPPDSAADMTPIPTLENICTNEKEVLRFLNALDSNKSTGPDNIPVKLLKMIALLIAKPLSALFNKSLTAGTYPNSFKVAHIKPILKNNGSPSDYKCYRPISILSALSKVFEKIVYQKIYAHLTEHSLLTEKQSGYRQHHSAEQQLLYLTHNLYKSLDTGQNFTAIYLDIAKYFDKIWHEGLVYKCKNDFGLSGNLLQWLESYLKDRKHSVRINETYSAHQIINAGCPQGSVLGPLLALIYLDGLSKRTKNDILFFADDTSLYAPHTTTDLHTAELSLQQDLDAIHQYGREWAITFNTTKTIQQTFSHKREHQSPKLTFGGELVPLHDNHKHLGMTFSKDLRFHQHINETCKKVNKSLSPLYPIAQYLPRPILDQIYKTYVRPYFDYCDTIYDTHITIQDATRLDTLQNRAARLTTGALFRTSSDKLRLELGWDKLTTRRHMHRLTLYHKLNQPEPHAPSYITQILPHTRGQDTRRTLRNAYAHTQERTHTTTYQRSFFIITNQQYNELPLDARCQTQTAFKKLIEEHLGTPQPPDFYTFGTKTGNILHSRLRNDMSCLNSHLFQIQKKDSPACLCGHKTESVRHFILSCPLHTKQRTLLFHNITQSLHHDIRHNSPHKQLQILLHGTSMDSGDGRAVAQHFQTFLTSSRRFDVA